MITPNNLHKYTTLNADEHHKLMRRLKHPHQHEDLLPKMLKYILQMGEYDE